jgi:hypothetical protein
MKCVLRIAVILILVAVVSLSAKGHRNPGLVLQLAGSHNSIFPDSAVWKVGEPVRAIVTMVNQSKRVVHYSLTNPGWDWEMDVRDSTGKPVGETDLFRQMKENLKNGSIIVSRNIIGTLRPNEKAQDVIEVQMFYDLSRPGEYSIQIQRTFPDVAKDPIKSNRLTLTITP